MLMEWKDLEVGDVLKFSDEFIEELKYIDSEMIFHEATMVSKHNIYIHEVKEILDSRNKLLEINSIEVSKSRSRIIITFKEFTTITKWNLTFDGNSSWIPTCMKNKPFKIISLNNEI